jgi:predicted  nucleic acid-binding Zn-ribbon protein
MNQVQTITKQLATYEAKVNDAEYQHGRAVQEIDHCRKESARLEVLLELGESTQADLDALTDREQRATRARDEASTRLELSHRAHGELQGRLEAAQADEQAAAKHEALLGYRDTAEELLGLLERVGERYAALRDLSRKVGDSRLEGVSKAGNLATERWPEYLRGDLKKIEARLSAEGSA